MNKKTNKIIKKMKKSCKNYTKDLFSFDEYGHLDKNKSIFDFKNIYEYEKEWKNFQLKFLEEKNQNEKQIEYLKNTCYLIGEWIKYVEIDEFKKEELIYSNLYSLEEFLLYKSDLYFNKLLNKYYPHEYWRPYKQPFFEKLNKNDKFSTMTDSELRAGGLEKELTIIKNNWYKNNYYQMAKFIKKIIIPYENYTFRDNIEYNKKEKIWECNDIIGSTKLTKKIRFTHFLKDMTTYKQPFGIIKKLEKEIKKEVKKIFKNKEVK